VVLRIIPDAQARLVALQSGEIDYAHVTPQDVPKLLTSKNLEIQVLKMDSVLMMTINNKKPMLADKRTRHAMAYAIDRQQLINTVEMGYGDVADSPWTPTVTAYEPQVQYGYDPAKAKALLAEVGWKAGPDGILVADSVAGVDKGARFSIKWRTVLANNPVCAVIQSYWKAVGIELIEQVQDNATYIAENSGKADKKFDVSTAGWGWLGSDAGAYSWSYGSGDAAASPMSFSDPKVTDLYAQARSAPNQAEADKFYKQAQPILWDDLPGIPLYYRQWVFAKNKRVHFEDAGINPSLLALYMYPNKIWVEK
jgi:peptide/nickel transport system substrate-binding protein